MTSFKVEVIIKNKPSLADPEGITIEKDLINKGGYSNINRVRTGKYINLEIEADSSAKALETVIEMIDKLRISNPVAHVVEVRIINEE
ncbi:MAG: phosphoribosylformylglycinamidine synthase subunit PurS [Candidatus Ranarchaeia archaeon]